MNYDLYTSYEYMSYEDDTFFKVSFTSPPSSQNIEKAKNTAHLEISLQKLIPTISCYVIRSFSPDSLINEAQCSTQNRAQII